MAIAGTAGIGLALAFGWSSLDQEALALPALVGAATTASAWIASALTPGGWGAIGKRFAASTGLGGWALVSALLAEASGSASVPFMVLVGAVLFAGGVVPVLAWLRRREEGPTERPAGKWR